MNTNKITIISSIIIVILLISVPTVYKVVKTHQDNLYKVVEEKIIAAAEKCVYEDKCKNKNITLKELYESKYLEKVSNPVSKEYYNESYVTKESNKYVFIEKE